MKKITSSNDLHNFLIENGHEVDTECNILLETEEQMTIEENGECSTIEILNNGETIWDNVYGEHLG